MTDLKLSRQIYRDLINGKTVNKHIYDPVSGSLKNNPKFDEITAGYDGENGYHALYARIGFELVLQPSYAYLRDEGLSADEPHDTAAAIQAVLTVLAKTVADSGYRYELLEHEQAGISEELCARADQNDEIRAVLEACGCDPAKSLWDEAARWLVRRDIAFINAKGNLVLADSGRDFFRQVFESGIVQDAE